MQLLEGDPHPLSASTRYCFYNVADTVRDPVARRKWGTCCLGADYEHATAIYAHSTPELRAASKQLLSLDLPTGCYM